MKRIAAGAACLTAALSGAYAAPVARHGEPRAQAAETLGDALQASIQDAIRGAVTNVEQHEAHHSAISLGRNVTRAAPALTQGSSLRGRAAQKVEDVQNPWRPTQHLRVLDNALEPVAPLDRLTPGIESQRGDLLPPDYYPRAVYHSQSEDKPYPFPQGYSPPVPEKSENFVICHTSPDEWVDKKGIGCKHYATALWCTKDGQLGPKWEKQFGTFATFAINNVGANQACCECGGGARVLVVGRDESPRLAERRVVAATDRVPDPKARWFEKNNFHLTVPERPLRPVQAPEDAVPLPTRQVAPHDEVALKYSRYFNEIHSMNQKDQPRGFSVRYFNVPPKACQAQPVSSSLDHSLEYGSQSAASLVSLNASTDDTPGFWVYPETQRLEWPGKQSPKPWWAKWSGTVMILEAGRYTFDLDVGFNTVSSLKVDGMKVLTDGQCKAAQDGPSCKSHGCSWDKTKGLCVAVGEKAGPLKASKNVCKAGTYRASPILFGCEAQSDEVEVMISPAGATTVLTVPKGVHNFQITVESNIDLDLQLFDASKKTWVVKFNDGVVNNQQRAGTYNGMGVSFSGDDPASETATLSGSTTSPLEVSLVSYAANPAKVKLLYSHGGLNPCPGKDKAPEGCKKLDEGKAKTDVKKWTGQMKRRYIQCTRAWKAAIIDSPGGMLRWDQWEPVWSMAWGQSTAAGQPGGAEAWQVGFAVVDSDHNGYVSEAEFMKTCGETPAAPAPPAPKPVPKTGKNQNVKVETCLSVKVNDKTDWPKGVNDPKLEKMIGRTVLMKDANGFPKGTYHCIQVSAGPVPAPAPLPAEHEPIPANSPEDSYINVKPIITAGDEAALIQDAAVAAAPAAAPAGAGAAPGNGAFLKSLELGVGGHCIEAMVMVTPSARNLKLTYNGPDTNKQETVIGGQMVHCDPIVPACSDPLKDMCLKYRPQCGLPPR